MLSAATRYASTAPAVQKSTVRNSHKTKFIRDAIQYLEVLQEDTSQFTKQLNSNSDGVKHVRKFLIHVNGTIKLLSQYIGNDDDINARRIKDALKKINIDISDPRTADNLNYIKNIPPKSIRPNKRRIEIESYLHNILESLEEHSSDVKKTKKNSSSEDVNTPPNKIAQSPETPDTIISTHFFHTASDLQKEIIPSDEEMSSEECIFFMEEEIEKENEAIKIQSICRKYLAITKLSQLRNQRQESAVVKLQSTFRKYLAITKLSQLRNQRQEKSAQSHIKLEKFTQTKEARTGEANPLTRNTSCRSFTTGLANNVHNAHKAHKEGNFLSKTSIGIGLYIDEVEMRLIDDVKEIQRKIKNNIQNYKPPFNLRLLEKILDRNELNFLKTRNKSYPYANDEKDKITGYIPLRKFETTY